MNAAAPASRSRIADLNDRLRQSGVGGQVVITPGLLALGPDRLAVIYAAVGSFDDFSPDNDPYGEHDFGRLEVDGEAVFFKIDYYDVEVTCHSPEPADPQVTCRVMTLMLAEDY